MPGFGDIVQKALYLGVGLASYAGEKANQKLAELRTQVQKLADELVARGEMTTDEARKFVDDMMKQATVQAGTAPTSESQQEPRRIEILSEDEPDGAKADDVEKMRQQVQNLQEELRRLKRDEK